MMSDRCSISARFHMRSISCFPFSSMASAEAVGFEFLDEEAETDFILETFGLVSGLFGLVSIVLGLLSVPLLGAPLLYNKV